MQHDRPAVALVNMPFSYSKYPSIQLGTLSALLKSKGTPVDCHHLNVRFALKIGVPLYEMICEKRALFGEWIFHTSYFATIRSALSIPTYLSQCLSKSPRRAVIRPRSLRTWRRGRRHSS
jgi:hypothetical protein